MFYSLPPVGNSIDTLASEDSQAFLTHHFAPYSAYFFASGAVSLAVAVMAVVRRSCIAAPEVIIPAYTCPEVVSAVLFAGARPVLVDLQPDRPWMDPAQVVANISKQTVAIIAINLFGIPERVAELREIIGQRSIAIIEDCAQAFADDAASANYQGDLVIHSFGRGKPVSVLGGGVVVCRHTELAIEVKSIYENLDEVVGSAAKTKFKIHLYNTLISPRCYWFPVSLPFLKLGQTVFHPLEALARMDVYRQSLLPSNIQSYQSVSNKVQDDLRAMLTEFATQGVVDLAQVTQGGGYARLLRYPVLLASHFQRDVVFERLHAQGLGVSKLYQQALPHIEGLHSMLSDQGVFPQASAFADRLLTLPTHHGVSSSDITLMRAMFQSATNQ